MLDYSTFHKAASLMVPGHSMTSTGTILVERKNVHWLLIGAASRNGLGGGGIPSSSILGMADN